MAKIAQINFYDPQKDTRVKCDASHSGLGATLEQSRLHLHHVILMFKKKKNSTNELEMLAVVWSVDRFKH